jgi:hypothetical protein
MTSESLISKGLTPRRVECINAVEDIFMRACPGWSLDKDDRGRVAVLFGTLSFDEVCASMETAVAAYALTSRERLDRFFAMSSQDYYDELLRYFFAFCWYKTEASRQVLCVDCDADTLAIGHYYMVSNDLWASAGIEPDGGMLCLNCLEKRIGRRLTYDDFTAIVPRAWGANRVAKTGARI